VRSASGGQDLPQPAVQLLGGGQGNLPARRCDRRPPVRRVHGHRSSAPAWHPIQPLAGRRPWTITSSTERSPLSSTDLGLDCSDLFTTICFLNFLLNFCFYSLLIRISNGYVMTLNIVCNGGILVLLIKKHCRSSAMVDKETCFNFFLIRFSN
jgi:hypothetical protein